MIPAASDPYLDDRLLALIAGSLMAALLTYLASATMLEGAVAVFPTPLHLASGAALAALLGYFCVGRPHPSGATLAALLLSSMIGLSLGVHTGYAVHFLGRGFPLADPLLLRFDRWIGYDATAFVRWFDRHTGAAAVLRFCYEHCADESYVAIVALAFGGRHERLLVWFGANLLTLVVVHFVAGVFPALGTHAYLGLTAADHPHIQLSAMADTARDVLSERAADTLFVPDKPLGLVTFPSYHMAAACLFGWALWPVRRLRWPAMVFNAGVAVSALLHGGHYIADLVAGAALAAACVASVSGAADHGALVIRRLRTRGRAPRPLGEAALA